MNRPNILVIGIFTLFFAVACGNATETSTATMSPTAEPATSTPTATVTQPPPTVTPTPLPTTIPPSPTTEPTAKPPTPTPSPSAEEPEPTAETAGVEPSALFDIPWQDYSPFEVGLIESQKSAANDLPGATVYHIDMQIENDITTITGKQEILYTNQEDVPLNEILFRLFPNLASGSSEISNLQANGQPVEPQLELRNSVARVPLAEPLQPDEQVVISMDFVVTVPDKEGGNYGTFAYLDDVLALAHFYPMVAVYDSEGWNVEIAPPIGDVVYADSSYYLVNVTAPVDQTLATSGVEIDRQDMGDQQTATYAAGPVRDFYIAASDRFEQLSRTVGETTINSYAPAELDSGSEAALDFAENSLISFNERFGPYPFTEFDMVSTTTFALGVEYPGIVAILIDLYEPDNSVAGMPANRLMEAVVAHEVAHQWFYSTIGNNQVDEPWVDEAMAQYATLLYYQDVYGDGGANGFRGSLERRWQRVDNAEIPIGMPVENYNTTEYGAIVYGRGPLFVEELAKEMGEGVFAEFLQDYYKNYRWGVATGDDFKQLAEQHCKCDLTPLFETWVYDNGSE